MWWLFWQAFESWATETQQTDWTEEISTLLAEVFSDPSDQLKQIVDSPLLTRLQALLAAFAESLKDKPSSIFWLTFLEMHEIFACFLYYQREGDLVGHLSASAKMLPYLTAAGHFKYGQQSLPLHLHEMEKLPQTAPDVHEAIMSGAFVGRRSDGSHNGVQICCSRYVRYVA